MADYNPPVSTCNLPPLAVQERESITTCVISNVVTNSTDLSNDKSLKSDQDVLPCSCINQIAGPKENGDLQCNGKPHLPASTNKTNAEPKSSKTVLADTASNVKKLNGVIHSELNITDGLKNNDKDHDGKPGNEVLETNLSHDSSQNCDVSSMDEIERENNCILEHSSSKDNEIDVLLNKLQNVSVVHTLSSCNSTCENKNEDEPKKNIDKHGIEYVVYDSERQMPDIMRLITKDLSEPYSIYTYRYFIHNWPKLCFLAKAGDECVGAIVCKLDLHKKMARRGYIAMLAVDSEYRRRQIGSTLVTKAIEAMIQDDCDEVVLETEITNQGALRLYENLGFVRDKRLFRYYLNGVDALRLKLWLR